MRRQAAACLCLYFVTGNSFGIAIETVAVRRVTRYQGDVSSTPENIPLVVLLTFRVAGQASSIYG